ncbi:MAG: chemotaxis protein, partial [Rhodospirillales bacterium]|nr:chemotaxis protein [Rhodospirillales bacterium]
MPTLARRAQRSTNTWPGFVDALATLLMVIIFLLMIFVLAQFFLNEAITGKDSALDKLRGQVGELAELLALERKSNTDLRSNVAQLSTELQSSVNARDEMSAAIQALTVRAEGAETSVKDLKEKSAE